MPPAENPFEGQELLPEATSVLDDLIANERKRLRIAIEGPVEVKEENKEVKQAKQAFKDMEHLYLTLLADGREREIEPLFEHAFTFLLQRETQGEEANLTIKSLHNMLVRDKKEDRFYKALFAYIAGKFNVNSMESREHHIVTLKAREFLVNRKRREAFWTDPPDTSKAKEAGQEFWNILTLWQRLGDISSQDRVLYELGQIAKELKDYPTAVRTQRESWNLARLSGDGSTGAIIAQIKMYEAMAKGRTDGENDQDPAVVIEPMKDLEAALLERATNGDSTARLWVSSYYTHRAEVYEAAGQIEKAKESYRCVLSDPYRKQQETTRREIYERAEAAIQRLEQE